MRRDEFNKAKAELEEKFSEKLKQLETPISELKLPVTVPPAKEALLEEVV